MRTLESTLTALGCLGLVVVAAAYLHAIVGSRQAIAAFEAAAADRTREQTLAVGAPDQSLWSEKRKREFAALADDTGPLALLEIERLDLQVPVYPGTDRITLNRGAGIVEGTAYPGEVGNVVMSAHRDGFFRALKDIKLGDVVTVRTVEGTNHFAVNDIFVTDPLDISVLEPTEEPVITLITCYPFYYVGFAPDRLIVRAAPLESSGTADNISVSEQARQPSGLQGKADDMGGPPGLNPRPEDHEIQKENTDHEKTDQANATRLNAARSGARPRG